MHKHKNKISILNGINAIGEELGQLLSKFCCEVQILNNDKLTVECHASEVLVYVILVTENSETSPQVITDTSWPWISALQKLKRKNCLPKQVILILAGNNSNLLALMQAQMQYITASTLEYDTHINIIYADYYGEVLSKELKDTLINILGPDSIVSAKQIANAAVPFCLGYMQGIKSQTITLRTGFPALDELMSINIFNKHIALLGAEL